MGFIKFENKAKLISELKQQLQEVTTDRDNLLASVKVQETKTEEVKQSVEAIAVAPKEWETEKTSLIEAHTKGLNEVTAKLQTEVEAKTILVKSHEEAVLKLNEQHKQDLAITDEKINQAVTAKLNSMNLSEGDMPADQKANPETKQRFVVTRIANKE
jgi:hypothetical protein